MTTPVTQQKINCPICLEPLKNDQISFITSCKHKYHKGCITPWLTIKNSCPVCRQVIDYLNNKMKTKKTAIADPSISKYIEPIFMVGVFIISTNPKALREISTASEYLAQFLFKKVTTLVSTAYTTLK